MKKFLIVGLVATMLTGCEREDAEFGAPISPWKATFDKELQAKAFTECMKVLPAGPKETVYNDWDEVVDSCRAAAREQAIVYKRHVGGGVWVTMAQWAELPKKVPNTHPNRN
ncbi:hypothetical protein Roomu2_00093 [Pseudomonas phage vB_PpuM-Roomu-2]|uniref:Lipoprotein n=1 Tax=Pseudomonas phage vB_PpuM-Roomu-2 TaxID=3132621 RepID=A0AAX4N092_9CAUD